MYTDANSCPDGSRYRSRRRASTTPRLSSTPLIHKFTELVGGVPHAGRHEHAWVNLSQSCGGCTSVAMNSAAYDVWESQGSNRAADERCGYGLGSCGRPRPIGPSGDHALWLSTHTLALGFQEGDGFTSTTAVAPSFSNDVQHNGTIACPFPLHRAAERRALRPLGGRSRCNDVEVHGRQLMSRRLRYLGSRGATTTPRLSSRPVDPKFTEPSRRSVPHAGCKDERHMRCAMRLRRRVKSCAAGGVLGCGGCTPSSWR